MIVITSRSGEVIRQYDGDTLRAADLYGADLYGADLSGADLGGAILPDGRIFEGYCKDPLAGLCTEPEARERAISAWGKHSWEDCPMHAAHGWDKMPDNRPDVATFVALFDAGLLPRPE